jgi:hypothetical protein
MLIKIKGNSISMFFKFLIPVAVSHVKHRPRPRHLLHTVLVYRQYTICHRIKIAKYALAHSVDCLTTGP